MSQPGPEAGVRAVSEPGFLRLLVFHLTVGRETCEGLFTYYVRHLLPIILVPIHGIIDIIIIAA